MAQVYEARVDVLAGVRGVSGSVIKQITGLGVTHAAFFCRRRHNETI